MSTTRNFSRTTKAQASAARAKTKGKPKPKPTPVATIDPEAQRPDPKAQPAAKSATPTKLSGLEAAAQVLRDAGEPLDVQTLIARILERGLWTTGGKTPAATIYSAMIREIKAKGSSSRFQKVDRGRFTAAG
jgi:hypothetical protein